MTLLVLSWKFNRPRTNQGPGPPPRYCYVYATWRQRLSDNCSKVPGRRRAASFTKNWDACVNHRSESASDFPGIHVGHNVIIDAPGKLLFSSWQEAWNDARTNTRVIRTAWPGELKPQRHVLARKFREPHV